MTDEQNTAVAAVVLNWNNYDDTAQCVSSLMELSEPPHVIVVDNGSHDGSGEAIAEEFPWIEVIFLDENRGFAGGMNAGIRRAIERDSAYLWVLNNDFFVQSENALTSLVRTLEAHDDVGIVSPKIFEYPNTEDVWFEYGIVDPRSLNAYHQTGTPPFVDFRIQNVSPRTFDSDNFVNDFVPLCSTLIDTAVFERVGLLDDEYFLYFEDVDFCLRARNAGYKIVTDTRTHGFHKVAGSSSHGGTLGYYNSRNRAILARKRGETTAVFFAILIWWVLLMTGKAILERDTPRVRGLLLGFVDGLTDKRGRGPFP